MGKGEGRMRESWIRFISTAMVIALLTTVFAPGVVGAQLSEAYDKEVRELAEALEFIFEEAVTIDENGNIIDFDIEKIEAEYGELPELSAIKAEQELILQKPVLHPEIITEKMGEEPRITPAMNAFNRCVNSKIQNWLKDMVPTTALAAIYGYVMDKEYTKAAKKILTYGVKGSVAGIAATLTWYMFSCTWEQDKY